MIFLGTPLGSHFKDPLIWNPIVEKNGEEAIWLEAFILIKRGEINFVEKYPVKSSRIFLILVYYSLNYGG